MAIFTGIRDWSLMRHVNRELLGNVITQQAVPILDSDGTPLIIELDDSSNPGDTWLNLQVNNDGPIHTLYDVHF